MTIREHKRIIYPIVAAVLASLLVTIVWFAIREDSPAITQGASFTLPLYSSFENLSNDSDAVVIGTVKSVTAREIESFETEYESIEKSSMEILWAFYEIDVTETLRGKTSKTLIVAMPDADRLLCNEVSALRAGQHLLLFLFEQTSEDQPNLKSYDHWYVPVSFNNGVFDLLDGDMVKPRMPEAFLNTTANGSAVYPTYNLSEVLNKIQAKQ
jgi:hypothetical protein